MGRLNIVLMENITSWVSLCLLLHLFGLTVGFSISCSLSKGKISGRFSTRKPYYWILARYSKMHAPETRSFYIIVIVGWSCVLWHFVVKIEICKSPLTPILLCFISSSPTEPIAYFCFRCRWVIARLCRYLFSIWYWFTQISSLLLSLLFWLLC